MKNIKTLFGFLLFMVLSFSLNAQPKLEVSKPSYEFGQVKQGSLVKHKFIVKNTGNKDLIITSVRASCGCTTPNWPKDPIKPGHEATIDVVFNTAGKLGKQVKTITINSNAEPPIKVLYLKGEVIK